VKSNARWEWSEAERVGARDERIDLIMGWNPNPGWRRIKRDCGGTSKREKGRID
jgi:hypothetical protein